MLNTADCNNLEPQPPFQLRVVCLDAPHVQPPALRPQRGSPRTADEWTALAKVGSGEGDISRSQRERLRTLGLIVTVSERPALTRHGRYTLGLPD